MFQRSGDERAGTCGVMARQVWRKTFRQQVQPVGASCSLVFAFEQLDISVLCPALHSNYFSTTTTTTKNVIIVTIMAAVLPRGSLFKNTEGWRKTKCRYVLTLEQKAMKWIKTRTKQTNTQTNRKKTKLYFCKRDVLLLKRYWRTCIYGSKDHSSISQNSYYWLVLICWLTKCFERRLASCYCLTLTRAFPCFAVNSVPFLLHLGSVQRPSFHCDREREVIKARGAPEFLFCSVLLPFLIL